MLKFLGGLTLTVVVFLGTFMNHMDGFTTAMVMIIAASELLKPLSVVEYHFQSTVQGRLIAQVNIVQTAASTLFKLALCWAGASLLWFAWSYVIDVLAAGVGYIYAYRKGGNDWRHWRTSRKVIGELLGQSWPLIIFGIALYVQAKIDQVMIYDVLKHIMPEDRAYAEVGQYSVALKMIEALGFVPVIVQKSLAPAITRARMEDPAKYHDRLLNFYRLMFLLFVVIAVPLYFLAPIVIPFFFGSEYTEAGVLLSLFAIRLFFTNMGVAKSSYITNESLFKYSLVTALVGASVNILLNYVLIPDYRSRGAIVATIVSFAISIFIVDLFYRNTRHNLKLMVTGIGTFWKLHRFQ
jgi:O-antigen/teichoic acid export membrane protein